MSTPLADVGRALKKKDRMARLEFQASKRPPVQLGGQVVIGRSADHAEVVIQDKRLSRRHCEFFEENGQWHVRDLKSANGTRVNGAEVLEVQPLKDGDELSLGGVLMLFSEGAEPELDLEDSDRIELDDDEAHAPEIDPVLKVITGTVRARLITISESPFSIGRREGNTLVLTDDSQASGTHAEIFKDGTGEWRIRDLGSTNGTRVNGKVTTDAALKEGARIQVGTQLFSFSLLGEEPASSASSIISPKAKDDLFDDQLDDELEMLEGLDEGLEDAAQDEDQSAEAQRLQQSVVEDQSTGSTKTLFRVLEVVALLAVVAAMGWMILAVQDHKKDNEGSGGTASKDVSSGGLIDQSDAKDQHVGFGSFERKDSIDLYGWRRQERSGSDSGSFVSEGAIDGGYCLEIIRRRPDIGQSKWQRNHMIALKDNDSDLPGALKFSLQYKRDASEGLLAFAYLEWFSSANENALIHTETRGFVTPSEDWQLLEGRFFRPEGATYCRFGVGSAGGSGRVFFDAAKLELASADDRRAPVMGEAIGELYLKVKDDGAIGLYTREHARNVKGLRGATTRQVDYLIDAAVVGLSRDMLRKINFGRWLRKAPDYLHDGEKHIWTLSVMDPSTTTERSIEVTWNGRTITIQDSASSESTFQHVGIDAVATQDFLMRDLVVYRDAGLRKFAPKVSEVNVVRMEAADMQSARLIHYELPVRINYEGRRLQIVSMDSSIRARFDFSPIALREDQELIEYVMKGNKLSDFEEAVLATLRTEGRSSEASRSLRFEGALALAKQYRFDAQALRFARVTTRDVVDYYRERLHDATAMISEGGKNAENPDRYVASVLEAKRISEALHKQHEKWAESSRANALLGRNSLLPSSYSDAHRAIADNVGKINDFALSFASLVERGRKAAFKIESRRQSIDASATLESALSLLADGENIQALLKLRSIVRRYPATYEATRAREALLERAAVIQAKAESLEANGLGVIAQEKREEAAELAALILSSSVEQATYEKLNITDAYDDLGGEAWIGMSAKEWREAEEKIRESASAFSGQ